VQLALIHIFQNLDTNAQLRVEQQFWKSVELNNSPARKSLGKQVEVRLQLDEVAWFSIRYVFSEWELDDFVTLAVYNPSSALTRKLGAEGKYGMTEGLFICFNSMKRKPESNMGILSPLLN